jgi:hypothetical protein
MTTNSRSSRPPNPSLWHNIDGTFAHFDSPAGCGGTGCFRSQGTWGRHPHHGSVPPHPRAPGTRFILFTAREHARSEKTGAKKPKKAAVSAHEVNVFGNFPSYWDGKQSKDIVKGINHWYPGTKSMKEFAAPGTSKGTKTLEVGEINALFRQLGEIGRHHPRTISRLNFFAHGADDGTIWVSGKVIEDNVDFIDSKFSLNNQNMLDAENPNQVYDPLKKRALTIAEQKKSMKENITIADMRQAFGTDATVVVYACHSAVDEEYLGKLGKLFGTRIQGFKKMTVWNLKWNDKNQITERRFGLEDSPTFVHDFHQLTPDIEIK